MIRRLAGRSGGAERLFCEMAGMFLDAGFEVTCLYCEESDEAPFYPISRRATVINLWGRSARKAPAYWALDQVARLPHARSYLAPTDWLSKNLYFTRRLYHAFKAIEPDVVISFLPPANTPALLAGALAQVKVIPTNHNVPEQDFRAADRWDQNPIDRLLRLHSLRLASRVHVLFPSFAGWFPPTIVDKVRAVPNYVSSDFVASREPAVGRARQKTVLAVGRLAPVKNYLVLVEAWRLLAAEHPDWCVKIFGVGPQRAELQRRIDDLGLTSQVWLPGHRSDIVHECLDAELFCHPALFEGFGLSVAEALVCGLPVVAFADCAGVNEFVEHRVNGLMVERSEGALGLAAALRRLIEDEALRTSIRARAPGSVAAFSIEAYRDNWLSLIDEAMAS